MRRVDLTRPYGEVYGQADHRYEQDGKLFDNEGNLIEDQPGAKAEEPAAEESTPKRKYTKRAPAEPESPVDGELAAQMQG